MLGHTLAHTRPRLLATAVAALVLTGCGPRWETTKPVGATVTTSIAAAAASTTPVTAATATTAVGDTTAATATSATAIAATTTTTLAAAAVEAIIAANWTRFFDSTTSIADRVALLENGSALQPALELRAQDPLQRDASAQVKSVELTAADHATVTYDVLLKASVALPNAQGTAVLQDGVWKVSAESFCSLISLGATAPIPGCG